METKTVAELKKIRADLDMLTNLYSKLVDRLIPEEEPEAEDLKAIRGKDRIASESELMKALEA
jgi:hypothetical protein